MDLYMGSREKLITTSCCDLTEHDGEWEGNHPFIQVSELL